MTKLELFYKIFDLIIGIMSWYYTLNFYLELRKSDDLQEKITLIGKMIISASICIISSIS